MSIPKPTVTQADRLFQEAQTQHQRGKFHEALKTYERAIAVDGNHALARIFRAVLLQQTGKPLDALAEAQKAVSLMKKPDLAILVNYGVILKNAGKFDEAAQAYEQALDINPKLPSAKSNLATIYLLQGKYDQAEPLFHELTEVMEEPAAWLNLARIAMVKQKPEDAQDYLNKASDLDPTHPDGFMLKARLASLDKDFETAYTLALRGLKRAPAHRDLWQILQQVDPSFYNLDEIESFLVELTKLNVQSATVLSIAVDMCRKNWLWKPLVKLETMLAEVMMKPLDKIPTSSDIFTLLGADVPQVAHLSSASACWKNITRGVSGKAGAIQPLAGRKLRVGVLSSDLRGHAIGYLVVGLFENLPKENIEWWAYSNDLGDSSFVRERLRAHFDRFINIAKLDDTELAERIRDDKIDILLDLNQMTNMTRVGVMAHRPAPIQMQWLGMPGTMGAGDAIDYIIVDPWVVDEKNADGFSEALMMLPRSYQSNDHVAPDLSLCASRADAGLPETGVVLGVFNQYYKFSPQTVALWGEIFKQLPDDSVLWLLDPKTDQLRERVLAQLDNYGIKKEQVVFAQGKPQKEHLARLQWLDLVLDTWPYNAHTTASDALRAGVPVLTFPQQTFASRVAAGILGTAGLSEWIAHSGDAYIQKAVAFAKQDRASIDAQKAAVKATYWASDMVDNAKLGREFEAMFLALAQQAEQGLAPTSQRLLPSLTLEALPYGRQGGASVNASTAQTLEAVDDAQALSTAESVQDDDLPDWATGIKRGNKQAKLNNLAILQHAVIAMSEIPLVVDVGAAPEGVIGYEVLADAGLARSLGFEPDPACFAKLTTTEHRQFAPVALADGKTHQLNICNASGMNSIYSPNEAWLSLFPGFSRLGTVKNTITVETSRLDDVEQAQDARFAKLDVQGAEMIILQNGTSILSGLSLLQIESSPTPLYHGETSLFKIGAWLEDQGFVLHTFSNENKRNLKPYGTEENPYSGKHHIFQVDAVFMPNPLLWDQVSQERLEALAFFAHAMYRSYDLAMLALDSLDKRDAGDRVEKYRLYLDKAGLDA